MRRRLAALIVALALPASGAAQPIEIIGDVRVHGNHTTPDADILALAGLTIGDRATDAALAAAAARLRDSGRFDAVEVRKRYRAIADPTDILVILLVDEVPGVRDDNLIPGPLTRLRSRTQWLPVVRYDDGYGFTYGARVALHDVAGRGSRLAVPLTWGGTRQGGVDAAWTLGEGHALRIAGGASLSRRVNPHFDLAETRREGHVRVEQPLAPWLRVGGSARLAAVRFGGVEATVFTPGAEATVDTRIDPAFPRNAVHLQWRVERLSIDRRPRVTRTQADLRGYVGLIGPSVLAVRWLHVAARAALPPYEQSLLGGAARLRGYAAGHRAGDNLAAASAELRVPLTSPVGSGRLGVKGFVDAGTVYPSGAPLRGQHFERGAGGGVFMTWTAVHAGLDVAWPISSAARTPRWHFGLGLGF